MHLPAVVVWSTPSPADTAAIKPGTFRSAVQPLVRSAALQGASVSEVRELLRSAHGRAYRRVDMLSDLRRYRAIERDLERRTRAFARFVDPRSYIARAGVAVFGVALLVPSFVHGVSVPTAVTVAATVDVPAIVEELLPPPPDPVARSRPAPEPEALPQPTPSAPPRTPRPAVIVPLVNGGQGIEYTASWYGPGFYENRLPCWQWLAARGLPIQLSPDTWGVAHKTLPCGSMVTLIHGANVVTVPVVDRGPYIEGREFDLSPRVKAALGCTDLCTVVMQIR